MMRSDQNSKFRRLGLLSAALATMFTGSAFAQATAEKEVKTDLPSPLKLMERHIEAVGGAAKIKEFTSRTMTGTFGVPAQGMEGTVKMMSKAPNMMITVMNLEGLGEIIQGFNGKIGWSMNDMQGSSLIEDEMLEQAKRDARFYSELEYAETYPTLETVEEVQFSGKAAYKVRQVTKTKNESFSYFDKESGFMIGSESIAASPMGDIPITAVSSEYKEFDGLMLSTRNVVTQMGTDIVITIETVVHNTVDDKAFETPEEIKSLIKASHDDDDDDHAGDDDDDDDHDDDDDDDDDDLIR